MWIFNLIIPNEKPDMPSSKIPDNFIRIPEFSRSTCFGCGPGNVAGLKMNFYSDNKSVISYVTVPEHFCGWQNIVHGGIVSTILDEIMGWTAIYLLKKVVLTKRMTVDFLKPVFVNQELFVQGEVLEMCDDRNAHVRAAITSPEGDTCAESHGIFRVYAIDEALQMGLLDKDILLEINEKFSRLS